MMDYVVVGLVGFVAGVLSWWLVSRSRLIALQTQQGHAQQRAAQLETLVGELRRRLAELELQLRQAPPAAGQPPQTSSGEHSRLRQSEDELAQARQRVTLLQAQLTTVKGRLPRLEDDVVQARQRAATAEATNQEHLAEVRVAQERAETLQNQLEQAAERIYQLEQELARAQAHPQELPGQPLAREARQVIASPSPGIQFPVGIRLPCPPRLAAEELTSVADEAPQILRPSESDEPKDVSPQTLELPEIDQPEERVPPPGMKAYCTKCRAKRVMVDPERVLLANERPAWKGTCAACGSSVFRFAKS
ncbi:MAG: hypothetical protein JW850_15950 [Thermoflexales bacterium]|nr:hypothetical protein [Thermoflexales bacterium]